MTLCSLCVVRRSNTEGNYDVYNHDENDRIFRDDVTWRTEDVGNDDKDDADWMISLNKNNEIVW